MLYNGVSLWESFEPTIYVISYNVIGINTQQANELTPNTGVVPKLGPPVRIFQNKDPDAPKAYDTQIPQNNDSDMGTIIPHLPILQKQPKLVKNDTLQDSYLPEYPSCIIKKDGKPEYPFPLNPQDEGSIPYIYSPENGKHIGYRPDNTWLFCWKPIPTNFKIESVVKPKIAPKGTKWFPYYFIPKPSMPGGKMHVEPRYI